LKDPQRTQWKNTLDSLVDYPADELGLRIGRDASFNLSHRHYSHLLMVYPIYDLNWDQPQNRDLIRRSLEQWKKNNSAWRGYSYTGAGSIYAMMGAGDSTWMLLNEMMKGRFSIKPNTMYLEAGPVIETPLSAVTTMNEMLLQSWGGVIRVFPAIPASWKDVSFARLLAKGAFEVSAERKDGRTKWIRIKSLAGSPCILRADMAAGIKTSGKRKFTLKQTGPGDWLIDLKKGEEIILYNSASLPPAEPVSVPGDGRTNAWGLNRQENKQ
jgi:alpha-L-fucosidase 2